MTTKYFVGEMFFPGLTVNTRHMNDLGRIVIGGDKGDVHASGAYNDRQDGENGAVLVDIELRTTLDLDEDEAFEMADDVVQFSFESVGEDAFIPSKKNE